MIVDASQSAGTAKIDMQAMGLDVVCFTGHKGLMGPQGTGGLAVAEGVDVAPWAMGGTGVHSFDALQPLEWPTRLEAGTLNGHGIAGLSAGLDFIEAQGGAEAIAARERALAERFLAGVREIPGIKLYGAFDQPMRSDCVAQRSRYRLCRDLGCAHARVGISTRPGAHAPRSAPCAGDRAPGRRPLLVWVFQHYRRSRHGYRCSCDLA
ncbi:MAG: aminotransferase class V-fold PLP-dependent enzyme [Collinsella aerofaciens]